MKRKPQEGEVWRDSDNEIVFIIKKYLNRDYRGNKSISYKVVEYTELENLNIMECGEHHLIEFVGYPPCPIRDFFRVNKNIGEKANVSHK